MAEKRTFNERIQENLIPFIKTMLIVLSLIFIVISSAQLIWLSQRIYTYENITMDPTVREFVAADPNLEAIKWLTISEIEIYAINQRYHQAHVLLISRMWIQYLSFFIGIIMVTIGAIFVLGRISDKESEIDVESKFFGRILFRSTSPGLLLAFLGVVLLIFSFAYQREIKVQDSSVYMNSLGVSPTGLIQPYDSTMIKQDKPVLKKGAEPPPDPSGN